MKGEAEVTKGFEAGKDLNMYKHRYWGHSRGKRKIQCKAQGLARGGCSVDTECLLKHMSRESVFVQIVSGFCRTPLTSLKMLVCFLFLEQLGH